MRTIPATALSAALALGVAACSTPPTPPVVEPPDETTTTTDPGPTTTVAAPGTTTSTTTPGTSTTTPDATTTTVEAPGDTTTTAPDPTTTVPPGDAATLRDAAAAAGIEIGTAVAAGPLGGEADYAEVLAREFSSVTAENVMKPETVQPQRGTFDFSGGDALVAAAEANDQVVRGHTLVWHSQNPGWLTSGSFGDDELREILTDHVTEVVTHYRGRIHQWDVANEVLDGNGQLRQESPWAQLGESYLADAFRAARAADPDAELFLNDYSIDGINAKSDAYYELVQRLLADGVPIDGMGFQAHLIAGQLPADMEANLRRFADLGLQVAITEVDVRMELPVDDAELAAQAETFAGSLEACLAVTTCGSYTVWGFTDRHSWVPDTFAGQGAATLLTDDLTPKPAYHALLAALP